MVKEKYTGSLHKMVVTSDRDHLEMNNRKFGYNKQTLLNNTCCALAIELYENN